MSDLFYWSSPAGVVHTGEFLVMRTSCGLKIPPIGSGWAAVEEQEVSCPRCDRALGPRPTRVDIDIRGVREYQYEQEQGPQDVDHNERREHAA